MNEFNKWNIVKMNTDGSENRPEYFRSRQVWWCRIGIPLTHTLREDDFNTSFYFNENLNCVGFTQIRTFDAKRLTYRIGMVSEYVFSRIIKKLKKIL